MSDYTVQIDWSGKDSLPDSSADKIISGSDFQTEFDAVELASATKANLNGSASESFSANNLTVAGNTIMTGTLAVSGNLTATTQTAGDNSTKVATTAYVDAADTTHAALRSSSSVFGHAKIYVSSGTLYIETA